jgi:hypothetical protein
LLLGRGPLEHFRRIILPLAAQGPEQGEAVAPAQLPHGDWGESFAFLLDTMTYASG